jgi:hypothetical protein
MALRGLPEYRGGVGNEVSRTQRPAAESSDHSEGIPESRATLRVYRKNHKAWLFGEILGSQDPRGSLET